MYSSIEKISFQSPPMFRLQPGLLQEIPALLRRVAEKIVLVRGSSSMENSGRGQIFAQRLAEAGITCEIHKVSGEPTPDVIDQIVENARAFAPQAVLAVGGGSVVDAGKAVAAMLTEEPSRSVQDFLEGVGTREPSGTTLPFWAMPTTSGTGSEATKNAVISRVGIDGFKKSLRHDNFIPDAALIDPELLLDCPSSVTAAAGMDTLSQLLESYFSTKATPITDALAVSGLRSFATAFPPVCSDKAGNVQARAAVAYAAYLSGLCLANAGLGTVHGIAGPLGGLIAAPHAQICGTLLEPVMKKTRELGEANTLFREKWEYAGRVLSGERNEDLGSYLENLVSRLGMTSLAKNILSSEIIAQTTKQSSNKNNPAELREEQIQEILTSLVQ